MSDLGDLGLSSYEAKAYRALLGLGPASAADVSAASEVPKGRIYDVLNSLSARDLVEVRESREPTRYVAAEPEEAVEVLLAERKRDLAAQREHYEDVAASVTADLAPVVPTRSQFWPAALGSDAAVSLIEQQFDVAEERIVSVMSRPYADVDLDHYARELEAIQTQIRPELDLRVLVSERLLEHVPAPVQRSMLEELDAVDARSARDLPQTIDVVDGETVFVHVPDPFGGGDRLGVIGVRDESFAERVEAAFEATWDEASPI